MVKEIGARATALAVGPIATFRTKHQCEEGNPWKI